MRSLSSPSYSFISPRVIGLTALPISSAQLSSAQQDKVFRSFEEVCAVLLQAMAPVIKVTYEPWLPWQAVAGLQRVNDLDLKRLRIVKNHGIWPST